MSAKSGWRSVLAGGISVLLAAGGFPAWAEETRRFCSRDDGIEKLIEVAFEGDAAEAKKVQDVKDWAGEIIDSKFVDAEGGLQQVRITWKDVYDLRGVFNTKECSKGRGVMGVLENLDHCLGAGLDAVGAGITGTTAGKVVAGTGLALAGPVGFVTLSAMAVTEEAVQCAPSLFVMAAEAMVTVVLLLPVCKAPGISRGCVAAERAASRGAAALFRRLFRKGARDLAKGSVPAGEGMLVALETPTGVLVEATATNGRVVAMEIAAPEAKAGSRAVEAVVRQKPIKVGVAHGSGAVSVEELSLMQQGRLVTYNVVTREVASTTGRAEVGKDTIVFLVRKNGSMGQIAGSAAAKEPMETVLGKVKALADRLALPPKPRPPVKVWEIPPDDL